GTRGRGRGRTRTRGRGRGRGQSAINAEDTGVAEGNEGAVEAV
ncbi:hypothetical protein PENNAL_c0521G06671, partial [Penicillium nalgiovense]